MLLITAGIFVVLSYLLLKLVPVWPRIAASWKSFLVLYNLKEDQVSAFLNSYDLFQEDKVTDNDNKIIDYYGVLNHLCSTGEVEKASVFFLFSYPAKNIGEFFFSENKLLTYQKKMYIPPIIDPKEGVFQNQVLFERKMMNDLDLLDVKKVKRVLDVGCGRGRVAAHVAEHSGSRVFGINIDRSQVENAISNAKNKGLEERLSFQIRNFNDPLPFEDNFFDAIYEIQVLTYAKDFGKLFSELHRVLKPGGKISILDWVSLEKFDPNNNYHQQLMNRTKPLIGAVHTPTVHEFVTHMVGTSFKLISSASFSNNLSCEKNDRRRLASRSL